MSTNLKEKAQHLKRLIWRNQAFQRVFFDSAGHLSQDGKVVLAELRYFCHAARPSYKMNPITRQIDPLATHVAEGRREVYDRLLNLLYLDDNEIRQQVKEISKQMRENNEYE